MESHPISSPKQCVVDHRSYWITFAWLSPTRQLSPTHMVTFHRNLVHQIVFDTPYGAEMRHQLRFICTKLFILASPASLHMIKEVAQDPWQYRQQAVSLMDQFCPDTPLGILSVHGLLLAQICPDKCIWLFFHLHLSGQPKFCWSL